MKYKNIIFDFGNVIASFDTNTIVSAFCSKAEHTLFLNAVFYNWQALDEGSISYEDYIHYALSLLPVHLHKNAYNFFQNWYKQLVPLHKTWELIHTLKQQGYKLYILSNAPTHFAEHSDFFEILKEFDGIIFSAPIHKWKPNPDIYQHLFETYHLNPSECFFIDDKEENIAAAKSCGMNGLVFTGDISPIIDIL